MLTIAYIVTIYTLVLIGAMLIIRRRRRLHREHIRRRLAEVTDGTKLTLLELPDARGNVSRSFVQETGRWGEIEVDADC